MKTTFLIWLLVACALGAKPRNFDIVFDKATMKHSVPDIIADTNCIIEQHNSRSYISAFLVFEKIVKQFDLRLILEYSRTNQWLTLADIRIDACKFLTTLNGSSVFTSILDTIKTSFNVLPVCPFKSHFNYTITNAHFKPDMLPSYTPQGQFRWCTKAYLLKNEVFSLLLDGRVVRKKP